MSGDDQGAGPGSAKGSVFTVPPGRPFLRALAEAILAGDLPRPGGPKPEPIDLPSWTILMPTRRAARTLQEGFLAVAGAEAMLLPAIRPIAEGQEDLGLIESAISSGGQSLDELTIPPAIGTLERTLLLTRLVLAWSRAIRNADPGQETDAETMQGVLGAGAATPAQAARLATELARLIDTVETEGVSLDKLADLVPDTYSEHWKKTLEFLEIVTRFWPAYLAENGVIAPADRRNRLILAEARRFAAAPPPAPVIVAGVTGSVPATAELMRAVAGLPNGSIVLPALDMHLDGPSFAHLAESHPEHPQFGLVKLLGQLGLGREDVVELPGKALPPARSARNGLVSEAMRPSGTMVGWRRLQESADRAALACALEGVSLVETVSSDDEAEVVSLILREALEVPGRTAALVSPDRLLARRVAARLEAWGIRVDDSAGRPFAKTVPGAFMDLVANAFQSSFAPAETMALLKHPLTRLGLTAGDVRRAARNLEVAAFRQTYLGRGLGSLEEAVELARRDIDSGGRLHRSVTRITEPQWEALRDLVQRMKSAFEPMAALTEADGELPLAVIVKAHVTVAEAVARPPEGDRPEASADDVKRVGADGVTGAASDASSPLWDREEGAAASVLLARLLNEDGPQPTLGLPDYAEVLRALIGNESIRTRVPRHPRLFIWGPFEARLQQPDVVVLGSLNEGVWPQAADPGPWLNRQMRATLGMPSPEEETGRSAHDVVALLGAETVYLTRANKVGGVPMVPSRWLLRLRALLDGLGLESALEPAKPWAAWGRARDLAPRVQPIGPPMPRPPVAIRPRRASVSDVETWLANPYAIYARRILSLEALPPLGEEPGPSDRGQIVHEALARFTKAHPDALPIDIVDAFMRHADDVIGRLGREPRVRAFWRPRLERFAQWFAETEPGRRAPQSRRLVEISGRLVLGAPAGPFELTARADRIDIEGPGLVITDYKTGRIPLASEVARGQAPQLPLEAAMAAAGVFPEVAAQAVSTLRYIRATGGEPAGEETPIRPKGITVEDLGAKALADLERLIADFDDEATPYSALRRRRFDYTYDDYAHLARIAEWAADAGEGSDT
jgi:ATP-dependent helicase/nuclease subunit B